MSESSPSATAVQTLEHIMYRALPALQTHYYDGWVMRFANGYTGRANSVNPVDGSSLDLAHKVSICEERYHAQELPTRFRLTDQSHPENLDAFLERRGYARTPPTEVHTLDMRDHTFTPDTRFRQISKLSAEWLYPCADLNGIPYEDLHTLQLMLGRITTPVCYGWLHECDALGMAVAYGDYVGLFKIVVSEHHRRQGMGNALVRSLLAWGKTQGATHAYLQVHGQNTAGLALYHALGFRLFYPYWYRNES